MIDYQRYYISKIQDERLKQDQKWGEQNHSAERWVSILAEEFGEMAREVNDQNLDPYETELIQTAAVALAMLECYGRKLEKGESPW